MRLTAAALTVGLAAACSPPTPSSSRTHLLAVEVLGEALFNERILSVDSSMSCGTCHIRQYEFAEPFTVSHGVGKGARRRNTPSIVNSAFQDQLGWAGNTRSLEEQAASTFSVDGDMGWTLEAAKRRLSASASYKQLFRNAFGRPPNEGDMLKALAAFERSVARRSPPSRFDRFYLRGDSLALSAAERRGWSMFLRVGCGSCHDPFARGAFNSGFAAFSDNEPHNLGVGYSMGVMTDPGRYEVTGDPNGWGAFITPSLRGVSNTSPYMHDGSLATLEDVIEFYARGGVMNSNLSLGMVPRKWTDVEKADLVAFLKAL